MTAVYARTWWSVLIRGIVAVLFGILAFIIPGGVLLTLVLLFGFYALVDGIMALVAAVRAIEHRRSFGLLVVEGVVGVLAGIITVLRPGVAAFVLVIFIAVWAVLTGIAEIVQAVELRRQIANEWLLILGGAASVVFGILLFFYPAFGVLTLIWLVGIYAIIFGVTLVGLSFRLRGMQQQGSTPTGASLGAV
jgi:uncharacterized membrane protein HdeD (DUF308 family)